MIPLTTSLVMSEIAAERTRQDQKWGEQNHPNGTGPQHVWVFTGPAEHVATATRDEANHQAQQGKLTWLDIQLEELAEAFAEDNPAKLRAELVQVAAVAVAWIEAIDRSASRTVDDRDVVWGIGSSPHVDGPDSAPVSSLPGDRGLVRGPSTPEALRGSQAVAPDTDPSPDTDPQWRDLCQRVATIADPHARDLAGDVMCDAYSLGLLRGVARSDASLAGENARLRQRLARLGNELAATIEERDGLGAQQAKDFDRAEEAELQRDQLGRELASERAVTTRIKTQLVEDTAQLREKLAAAWAERDQLQTALSLAHRHELDYTDWADAVRTKHHLKPAAGDDDFATIAKHIIELHAERDELAGTVARYRHVVQATTAWAQEASGEHVLAMVAAVEALKADDVAEPESTNEHETATAAAFRFASELGRLADALDQRGIPLRDGPVEGAQVDTAIDTIDQLRTDLAKWSHHHAPYDRVVTGLVKALKAEEFVR